MTERAGAQQGGGLDGLEKQTDLPVGEILRRARLHYNLTLEDVARALRIRASQLGALEDSRADLLPGRVYAIGYVRAYSEYLGLDGDKMVYLFKSQQGHAGGYRPMLSTPAPASESKTPGLFILGGSLAALVLLFAAVAAYSGISKARRDIPPVPENVTASGSGITMPDNGLVELAMLGALKKIDNAKNLQTFARLDSRIVITVKDSVWLEIRNAAKKPILSRILKAGDRYLVPDEAGLVLDTGNIGALEFSVDGAVLPPLGGPSEVKRGVKLDPETLKPPPPPVTEAPAEEVPAQELDSPE